MKHFYRYDATGRVTVAGNCVDTDFDLQSVDGETLVEGVADPLTQYVESGALVDREPAPSDSHVFDWATKTWSDPRTAESEWVVVRRERDRRLAACDWVVARASENATVVPADWKTYRQALRDVTTQADPFNVVWPDAPSPVVAA